MEIINVVVTGKEIGGIKWLEGKNHIESVNAKMS